MERAAILAAAALLSAALVAPGAYAARHGSIPKYITEAVADKARPAADTERDANRKPAETLAFAGVKPGDAVVELAPGKGYYTRLLSAVVGPKGSVTTVSGVPKPDAPRPHSCGELMISRPMVPAPTEAAAFFPTTCSL